MIYVVLGIYIVFAFSSPIIVMRLVRRHNVKSGRNYLIALAIVIGGIIIVYLTMFLFFWLGTVR